jgi:hypothetical protein
VVCSVSDEDSLQVDDVTSHGVVHNHLVVLEGIVAEGRDVTSSVTLATIEPIKEHGFRMDALEVLDSSPEVVGNLFLGRTIFSLGIITEPDSCWVVDKQHIEIICP